MNPIHLEGAGTRTWCVQNPTDNGKRKASHSRDEAKSPSRTRFVLLHANGRWIPWPFESKLTNEDLRLYSQAAQPLLPHHPISTSTAPPAAPWYRQCKWRGVGCQEQVPSIDFQGRRLHPCTRFVLADLLPVGSPMLSFYQHQQEESMLESHPIIGNIQLAQTLSVRAPCEEIRRRRGMLVDSKRGSCVRSQSWIPFGLARMSRYLVLQTITLLTLDMSEGAEPYTPPQQAETRLV